MNLTDKTKRHQILDTAARLFAAKHFHEVKLDAIAAKSRLGKGTIYLYFKSKEDLYAALIVDGLEKLLREIETQAALHAARSAWKEIEGIVDALLGFARRNPHLYTLMRYGGKIDDRQLNELKKGLAAHCERAIRRGVRNGELADPHPELTAQYLLSFIRVALLYAPEGIKETTLRGHILRVLGSGIRKNTGNAGARALQRRAAGQNKPRTHDRFSEEEFHHDGD